MNPEQALKILDQIRLQASMVAANHDAARDAVAVLKVLIDKEKLQTYSLKPSDAPLNIEQGER